MDTKRRPPNGTGMEKMTTNCAYGFVRWRPGRSVPTPPKPPEPVDPLHWNDGIDYLRRGL